jgi:hypothetical protein
MPIEPGAEEESVFQQDPTVTNLASDDPTLEQQPQTPVPGPEDVAPSVGQMGQADLDDAAGITPAPEEPQAAQPNEEPMPTEQDDDDEGSLLGDLVRLPLRVAEGVGRDLYGTLDFLSFDALPDLPKEKLFGQAQTLVGGLLTEFIQFGTMFFPIAGGVGRLSGKLAKFTPKHWNLTTKTEKALYRLGRKKTSFALGAARAEVAGVATDWMMYEAGEERLSNLLVDSGETPLNNAFTQYLAATGDESEAEGRFKQAMEGTVIGQLMGSMLFVSARVLRQARKIKAKGGTIKQADEMTQSMKGEYQRALENPTGKDVVNPEPMIPDAPPAGKLQAGNLEADHMELDDADLRFTDETISGDEADFQATRDPLDEPPEVGFLTKDLEDLRAEEKVLEQKAKGRGQDAEKAREQLSDMQFRISAKEQDLLRMQEQKALEVPEIAGQREPFSVFGDVHEPAKSTRSSRTRMGKIKKAVGSEKDKPGERELYASMHRPMNDTYGVKVKDRFSKNKAKTTEYFTQITRIARDAVLTGEFHAMRELDEINTVILNAADDETKAILKGAYDDAREQLINSDPDIAELHRRGGELSTAELREAGMDPLKADLFGARFGEVRSLQDWIGSLMLKDPSASAKLPQEIKDIVAHGQGIIQAVADGMGARWGKDPAQRLFQADALLTYGRVDTDLPINHKVATLRFVTPEVQRLADAYGMDAKTAAEFGYLLRQNPRSAKYVENVSRFLTERFENRQLNMRMFTGGRDSMLRLAAATEEVFGVTAGDPRGITDTLIGAWNRFQDATDPLSRKNQQQQILGTADELSEGMKVATERFFAAEWMLQRYSAHAKTLLDDFMGSQGRISERKKGEIMMALKALNDAREFTSRFRTESGRMQRAAANPIGFPEPPFHTDMPTNKPFPLHRKPPSDFPGDREMLKGGGIADSVIRAERQSPTEAKEGFKRLFSEPPRDDPQVPISREAADRETFKEILDEYATREGADIPDDEFQDLMDQIIPLVHGGDEGLGQMLKAARLAAAPKGWKRGIKEWWYNSLLSSGKTATVNAIGTAGHMFVKPLEIVLGAAFRGDAAATRRGLNEVIGTWAGMKDFFKWFRAAWLDKPRLDPGRSRIEGFADRGVFSTADMFKKWEGSPLGAVMDTVGSLIRFPSRMLQSTDEAFKQITYRSNFRADIADKLMAEGIDSRAAWEQAESIMQQHIRDGQAYSAAMVYNRGKALADEYGVSPALKDQFARDYVQRNYDKSLGASSKRAIDVAKDVTFQTELAPNTLPRAVNNAANHNFALRMIIPFVRTPSNLLYVTGRHFDVMSPMKLMMAPKFRGVDRADYLKKVTARHSMFLQDVASGEPHRVAEAWGRLVVGYSAAAMIFAGVQQGLVTGAGPTDERKRKAWEAAGWKPFSFKIGDSYVSYERVDPAAGIWGIAAQLAEHMAFDPDPTDPTFSEKVEALTVGIAVSIAHNIDNKTYISGLMDSMDLIADPLTKGPKFVGRLGGSFVPSVMADQARFLDPHERELQEALDFIKTRVVGWRQTLPMARNFLGEPVDKPHTALTPIFGEEHDVSTFFVPFAYSKVSDDLIDLEVQKLGYGFTPPPTTRGGVDLTEQLAEDGVQTAYDRWMELHGEVKIGDLTLREALREMIQSEGYQALTEESTDDLRSPRIRLLRKLIRQYRQAAFAQLQREIPGVRETMVKIARQKQGLLLGVPVEGI